jgi:hypothetical protein
LLAAVGQMEGTISSLQTTVATQSRTIKDHSKAPSWSPQGGQQVLNTPLMEGRSVCDTI